MLTPEQVTAVARDIIGHMTTDPAVRKEMDIDPTSPGAAAALASAISAATMFSTPGTAADSPAILTSIKSIAQGQPGLELVNPTGMVLFFKC
jgi:hypothetical protein